MPFLRRGSLLVIFFNKLKEEWFRKMSMEFVCVCVSYLCWRDHRSQCYCLSCFYYSSVNVHDTSKFCTYVKSWCCTWLYIILYLNLYHSNEEYGNMPWPIAINLWSSKFIAKLDDIVLFMRVKLQRGFAFLNVDEVAAFWKPHFDLIYFCGQLTISFLNEYD